MKKLLFTALIIISITITGLVLFSNQKHLELEVYSIPKGIGYTYEENKNLNFELYSNQKKPAFTFVEDNIYTIETSTSYALLSNVKCNTYEVKNGYIHKFEAALPNLGEGIVELNSAKLHIKNTSYTLIANLGSLTVLNPVGYELLDFSLLNGCYSKFDNDLYLVGITLKPNIEGKLQEFSLGGFASGRLDLIIEDVKYENEININDIIKGYRLAGNSIQETYDIEEKSYFIPLIYKKTMLVFNSFITLKINDRNYYIDQFPYKLTDNPYEDFKVKGRSAEIIYA